MKNVLIIGATSAIAEACARLWANKGYRLYLVARNEERLQYLANDLLVRGAKTVHTQLIDLNQLDSHVMILHDVIKEFNTIDMTLISHGTLGDQTACEQNFYLAHQELNTNAISVISLLTCLANQFEQQKKGTIAVISSVAGDKGRQSNYVYGTAKAAISTFLQGLRQRLDKSGVHVLTVKPGFVDSPMTKSFKKNRLWVKPKTVAYCIDKAIRKNKDVVYIPGFWFIIMTVIRLIPEKIFKRLSL